jgi:uncharacterized membrane protein
MDTWNSPDLIIMLCAIVKSWLISWLMSLLKVNRNSHLQNSSKQKTYQSVRTFNPFFTVKLCYIDALKFSQGNQPTCFDNV